MVKKANILHENIIFIILNVVFFSTMILFIFLKASSVHLMEEETAKQVALIIDAANPGTTVEVNLKDFFRKAEKEEINKMNTIKIDNEINLVTAKGSEDSYYEYSYFNDVDVGYTVENDYLILVFEGGENE